jgi:tetratricopeptide (TPR) repeat protein
MITRLQITSIALWLLAPWLLACLLAPCTALANNALDPYAKAMTQAAALERAGKSAQAASALAAIEPRYRQDYALQLKLGWLYFKATRYVAAERHYRRALALSPRSLAARHGLAWTQLRRGRALAAREGFLAVLSRQPLNRMAKLGLSLSKRGQPARKPAAIVFTTGSTLEAQLYQNHPVKSSAFGLSAMIGAQIIERLSLAARYRYTSFSVTRALQHLLSESFDQHELYLSSSFSHRFLMLEAHYGLVHDGSDTFDSTHQWAVGASVSLGALGRISALASGSHYDDMTVLRATPRYRVTLWQQLSFDASLMLTRATTNERHGQLEGADEQLLISGALAATLHVSIGDFYVGGRVGDQVRPADLALGITANSYDRVGMGLFGGFTLDLARLRGKSAHTPKVQLDVGYELVQLETPLGYSTLMQSSTLHLFTLGVRWTF